MVCTYTSSSIYHDLTCKRGSVGQPESGGLFIPRSLVWFRLNPENSNSNGFDLIHPQLRFGLFGVLYRFMSHSIEWCKSGTQTSQDSDFLDSTKALSLWVYFNCLQLSTLEHERHYLLETLIFEFVFSGVDTELFATAFLPPTPLPFHTAEISRILRI